MSLVKIHLNTNTPSPNGTFPVVMELIHQRNKKTVKTSYQLDVRDFDAKKQRAAFVSSTQYPYTAQEVNKELEQKLALMNNVIGYLDEYIVNYDANDVIKLYNKGSKGNLLIVFLFQNVRQMRINKQYGTANTYNSILSKLQFYAGASQLTFEEIDKEWVDTYQLLLTEKKLQEKSVLFYLRIFCVIYNHAQQEGIVDANRDPFAHLNLTVAPSKDTDLEDDELRRIIEADLSHDKELTLARDLFMFSYHACGMSFMDMAHFKKTDVKENMLTFFCYRTRKITNVKLTSELRVIIDKYINTKGVYLLPIFDSEKRISFNDYRKKMKTYNARLSELALFLEMECNLNCQLSQKASKNRNLPNELIITISNSQGKKETVKIVYTSIEEAKAFLIKTIDGIGKR